VLVVQRRIAKPDAAGVDRGDGVIADPVPSGRRSMKTVSSGSRT
jgi:hypothetical protein